ncbi:hypothetical protein COO60DRAFT_1633263 [Scenedesmus sp. NREL 46B-D3]|nr:hypothetical protein COO60DRAFT_1633263 [Scenedesmus sp. NREL 46B-D3]
MLSDNTAWQQLEPHFGSKFASQLLEKAASAAHTVPGDAAGSAGAAADSLMHLPADVQQRLGLLEAQLQQLAAGSGSYEPHFGTRAVMAWLQEAVEGLLSVVHDSPMLQPLTANAAGFPATASGSHQLLLHDGVGSGSSSIVGGFGGAGDPTAALQAVSAALKAVAASAAASMPAELSSTLNASAGALAQQSASAAAALQQVQGSLAQVGQALQRLPEQGMGGYDFPTLCLVAAGAVAAIAASVPAMDASTAFGDEGTPQDDVLSHDYDAQAVARYFERRPVMVAQRAAQLAAEMAGFGVPLLGDLWTGRMEVNEHKRAEQLRGVIERLGPAYVKVAQAMSTRVDLLSPEYYMQIQLLQDRVPPFPCDQAKEAMATAFGRPVDAVFSQLSSRPVAAASLGQVYKGRLRPEFGGREVAVKVQRPDVLEQVCLDLYLMRQAAEAIGALPEVKTDWASLIDNWAVRFLHEMDYTREAANAHLFRQQMADAGVSGVVTADVVEELSTDVVLTTQWMDGEKLSESRASDVRELCNTLLSAYLIQLLDTGLLHADPHPGNLIRTTDGKICVLDFGLMTEVTPEQRIALVEYIAHLSIQDWENVARDLQTLGFIPADAGDPVAMGMAQPLGNILVQLSGGGGAAKLNIDAVMGELEDLGSRYPFRIPPFFTLILRAFSVIEGIALAVDPDYSIVQECFPYLARRLLADDDPRVRKALRDVLYGGRSRLDVQRLIKMADAFSAYTTDGLEDNVSGAPAAAPARPAVAASLQQQQQQRQNQQPEQALSPAAKDALLAVFSRRGSYVQELLVEELVAAADALSRDALSQTLRVLLGSRPVAVAMSSLEALGPLRPLLLPLTTPLELISRLAPAVQLTEEDEEALGVVRGIFQLVARISSDPPAAAAPAAGSSGGYRSVGLADTGNAASGMVFSTTELSSSRLGGLAAAGRGQQVGPRAALAAAAEAVNGAAGAARELQPILPELIPGLQHTGELFVRAFVRRVTLRLAESFTVADPSSSGGSSSVGVDDDERALAMAALGFVAGPDSFRRIGNVGLPAGFVDGGNSSNGFAMAGGGSSSRSVASVAGGLGAGPSTAGQLVTGLVAAPLLAVLTPLAVLTELQRKQQRDRQ